jgi:hypothetical protein
MKISHKTLLIISCISISLYSMEDENKLNFYAINDIYKKTYNTLENYNPTDIQSAIALSAIITKTKELKSHNINEQQIGKFAYKQEDPIKNKLFSNGNPPYHGPHYVCIFFERVAQYNANLEKNAFTSPTIEQFSQYLNNQKITAAVKKAATFRLFLDLEKINAEKKIIVDIPMHIAVDDFEKLIQDIAIMRAINPEEIKMLANILYGFDIKKKPLDTSEKL